MATNRDLLTLDEIALLAGVHRRTVRRWAAQGLPTHRLGRRLLRVSRTEFEAWLRDHDVHDAG